MLVQVHVFLADILSSPSKHLWIPQIISVVDPLQSKAIKIVDPRQSKAKRKFCENNLTNYRVIHGRNLPSLNVKKIS